MSWLATKKRQWCCDEMTEAIKDEFIGVDDSLGYHLVQITEYPYRDDITCSSEEMEINWCPFCRKILRRKPK